MANNCPQLVALGVNSLRCDNLSAFGAERTFNEPRLLKRIYEYTA